MSTQEVPKIYPALDGKTETWWHVDFNDMELKAVQKKNKHGEPLEPIWVYTRGGWAYYATTSLAKFSQKHWFEQFAGVKLARKQGE